MRRIPFVCAVALAVLGMSAVLAVEEPMKYPSTRRVDQVDDYHGTKVADPYRWLEDDVRKSKDVADWVEAENKVTFAYLKNIPERDAIREAPHRPVELREALRPVQDGRPLLLLAERRPAEPVGALHVSTRSTASRACCSTRTRWSKDGTVALIGHVRQRRRQVSRLRHRRGRLRLEHLEGARHRHGQAARRRAEVGQVQRRLVDQGQQGLLLQPLRRAEGRRQVHRT